MAVKRSSTDEVLRCSFCHKGQDAVRKLIASPGEAMSFPTASWPLLQNEQRKTSSLGLRFTLVPDPTCA